MSTVGKKHSRLVGIVYWCIMAATTPAPQLSISAAPLLGVRLGPGPPVFITAVECSICRSLVPEPCHPPDGVEEP